MVSQVEPAIRSTAFSVDKFSSAERQCQAAKATAVQVTATHFHIELREKKSASAFFFLSDVGYRSRSTLDHLQIDHLDSNQSLWEAVQICIVRQVPTQEACCYKYTMQILHGSPTEKREATYSLQITQSDNPSALKNQGREVGTDDLFRRRETFALTTATAPNARHLPLALTLLGPQSRFGDKLLKHLTGLSPKWDCSTKGD